MLNCKFCGKECKNNNSLSNHQRLCKHNPERQESNFVKFNRIRVPWNKGMTKETNESLAKCSEKLTKLKPSWQVEVDDDNKLYQKYCNKRVNARAEGLICELTFEQYCSLVKEANLVSSQLGFNGEGYVLARYNDSGNYVYGNCRFILQSENAKERKLSRKCLNAVKHNMNQLNQRIKSDLEFKKYVQEKRMSSKYYSERRKKALEKQAIIDANKDIRYCKEHNSQYGTYWITDGTTNKKWSDKNGPIPDGFRRGRVTK